MFTKDTTVSSTEKYAEEYYVTNTDIEDSSVLLLIREHPNVKAIQRYETFIYGNIIDIGSGHSATTLIAAENPKVIKAVGVNLNQAAIDRFNKIKEHATKEAKEKTSMVCSNVLELNKHFDEESFDTVMSFHMLEHLFKEDIDLAMEQMSRILKPGGMFIISIPWERQLGSPNHKTYWNDKTLSALFLKHAYTVHECYKVDDKHLTGAFIKC